MTQKAPAGLKPAGRRLWRSVLANYELDEHELALLIQAAHAADLCDDLQAIVSAEGVMREGRPHPAAVELRQQRIVLARLIVCLRVPIGDQEEQPSKTGSRRSQRRPIRGMYAIKGLAS